MAPGDKNTRFFHISTLKHRAANRISKVQRNGTIFDKVDAIREEAVRFFSNLLKAKGSLDEAKHKEFIDAIPRLADKDCKIHLMAMPSLQEIKKVVFSFEGKKNWDLMVSLCFSFRFFGRL